MRRRETKKDKREKQSKENDGMSQEYALRGKREGD